MMSTFTSRRRVLFRRVLTALLCVSMILPMPGAGLLPSGRAIASEPPPPPNDDPINPCDVPCPDCPCEEGGGGAAGSGGSGGPGRSPLGVASGTKSNDPVFFLSGSVIERATDIQLPGPKFGWSFERTYNSNLLHEYTPTEVLSPLGTRWVSTSRGPYLVQNGGYIEVVVTAASKRLFSAGSLTPPADYNATMALANSGTANETYTLTETDTGNVFIFHGLSTAVAAKHRGRLKERTTRAWRAENKSGISYTYNTSGYVATVIPAEPQDTSYSISFTYYSGGDENGRLQIIDVLNGATVIQRVEYTYRGNSTSYHNDLGSTGDLVQVKVSTKASGETGENFSIVRYTQYRYHRDGGADGEEHQLKMVLEPDAIQRVLDYDTADAISSPEHLLTRADDADIGGTGGGPTAKDLKEFASRAFTYYVADLLTNNTGSPACLTPWYPTTGENLESKYGGWNLDESTHPFGYSGYGSFRIGMVKSETINGGCASCGSSTAGGVKKHYFYTWIKTGNPWQPKEPDHVVFLVVEDTVDAANVAQYRRLYGVNYNGVAVRKALLADPRDGYLSGDNIWCESEVYDDQWRIIERRLASAHKLDNSGKGVDSNADLVKFLNPTNNGDSLSTNDTDTVSTTDGAVNYYEYNADGYPTGERVRKGLDTDTDPSDRYYVSATDWGDGTDDKPKWLRTATYTYPTKTATRADGKKTSYANLFWDTADTQLKKTITTLPAVSTAQNGSGIATTTEEYYDKVGRLRWTKDGEGYVNYYSFHPTLGDRAFSMVDVNDPTSPGTEITSGSSGKWIAWTVDGADSNKPTRGSGLPAGLGLVTKQEFDAQGKTTLDIDTAGSKHYTVYDANRTLRYSYWNNGSNRPLLPIEVTDTNAGGAVTQSFAVDPARTAQSGGVPTGLTTGTNQNHYTRWTRYFNHKVNGQLVKMLRYHDIPSSGDGTHITNYYVTGFEYDGLGRRKSTVETSTASVHQMTQVEHDDLDRVVKTKRNAASSGVDTGANSTLGTLSTSGYVSVTETQYDLGSVGDSHLTSEKRYYGTGANEFVETAYKKTFRGHLRGMEQNNGGTAFTPRIVIDTDWLGRTMNSAQYTSTITWSTVLSGDGYTDYVSGASTGRNELKKAFYDDLGNVFRMEYFPGGGAVTKRVQTNNYYDRNGRLVATGNKNDAHNEYAYDSAGRHYQIRIVTDVAAAPYSSGKFQYRAPAPHPALALMTGGDDGLIEFSHTVYDAAGNAIEEHTFELNHIDTDGINIGSMTSYVRRTMFSWHDGADRLTTMADYGSGDTATGPGVWKYTTAPSRATAPTTSSDTSLVTKYGYSASSGRQETTTDPVGIVTKVFYDDLGRRTFVAENFDNFNPPTTGIGDTSDPSKDRITGWVYNGLGLVTKLTAHNGSSEQQVTDYFYLDDYDASRVTHTIYPDATSRTAETSFSASADQVRFEYDLDGSIRRRKDQRDVVIEYTYDSGRRPARDGATTVPSAVDGAIRSISRTYDSLGRVEKITSWSNSDGTGSVQNEIKYTYHSTYGYMQTSEQSHEGVVGVGTLAVQYSHDDSVTSDVFDDGLRRESVTYPKTSRVIYFGYGGTGTSASVGDRLGRVAEIRETNSIGTQLTAYSYNGTGRLAIVDYPQQTVGPQIRLDLFGGTSGTYTGLDRFARTKTQKWVTNTAALRDQVNYTYDYAGNRLTRDIPSSLYATDDRDEAYAYDGLHRLRDLDQGQIGGTLQPLMQWSLDQLGNWSELWDNTGGRDVTRPRQHNQVNEITEISEYGGVIPATPQYDAAGNTTEVPKPNNEEQVYQAKYDAWNRLVELKDGANVVATMEYDGLGRRIQKVVGSDTYDYYYNQQWQLLEERKNGSANPLNQYVWHPYFIDALAVRYWDSNIDGDYLDTNEGAHYYLHDANFNVTSVVNASGSVLERYAYMPYGQVAFLNADFSVKAQQVSAIGNNHLYTGRERDPEAGLQLNRHRFYDAPLGRWVTRDPIAYKGGWNLYEYLMSRPSIHTDAFGLYPSPCTIIDNQGCTVNCLTGERTCPPPKPPTPDEKKLRAKCDTLCPADDKDCKDCTKAACEKAVDKILKAKDDTWIYFSGWNRCQRWVFEFEKQLGPNPLSLNPCIKEANIKVYDLPGRLSPRHVTYVIIFCDGTKVEFDVGTYCGDDHIRFPDAEAK